MTTPDHSAQHRNTEVAAGAPVLSPEAPAAIECASACARRRSIDGLQVDVIDYAEAVRQIIDWAAAGESRSVCVANAHSVVDAADDLTLRAAINGADLVTPDGMPLVWTLRRMGHPEASRVYGPELMLQVCTAAQRHDIPVGLFGGRPERLASLVSRLRTRFPDLELSYQHAPPFRPLTPEEQLDVISAIESSGARILFVGLGCPKQELWMAQHRGRVPAVMLGVGAAFDFHAGFVPQAPALLQKAGLEWAFRLAMEPRRLWRRYARVVPRFTWRVSKQLLKGTT